MLMVWGKMDLQEKEKRQKTWQIRKIVVPLHPQFVCVASEVCKNV